MLGPSGLIRRSPPARGKRSLTLLRLSLGHTGYLSLCQASITSQDAQNITVISKYHRHLHWHMPHYPRCICSKSYISQLPAYRLHVVCMLKSLFYSSHPHCSPTQPGFDYRRRRPYPALPALRLAPEQSNRIMVSYQLISPSSLACLSS
ncbi:hypothetical protein BU23DRAFT_200172 [Bimuria novae-zelandiae CBS 107.79]|uniref:Uncharacterized protein n=1 Tax=Bimuria novae-zelandiae CBS 107.79 TaxID=1447943 RepID=A0A6A5VD01_9PLEO|nr:hypothetical protein BU23DRAFT_200172 [Bimuria novae-zelandiae CBS 107.79]